jgi:serine/threonine-protein kinase
MSNTLSQQADGLTQGQLIAGKYRIERVLGRGGFGVVVAAHHEGLKQRVAIKFLLPEALKNPEIVARFTQEARTAFQISSEHVGKVMDVGELATGEPYMVMEWLDGRDLSEVIRVRGRLAPAQAIDYVLQACEALVEAHQKGITHRDLKPANLFLVHRPDGSELIKVLDFGISKVVAPDQGPAPGMTATNAVFGTPYYMAPEQMRASKFVDARSDIWALGIIFFELLTGRVPFDGDTPYELGARILNDPTPSLRGRAPEVSAELEAVILRCLEKEPARRYQNVGQFSAALAIFAPRSARISLERISRVAGEKPRDFPPSTEPTGPAPTRVSSGHEESVPSSNWVHTHFSSPTKQKTALALGALVVGLAATAGALSLRRVEPMAGGSASPVASPVASPMAPPPEDSARTVQPVASASTLPTASATAPAPAGKPDASPGRDRVRGAGGTSGGGPPIATTVSHPPPPPPPTTHPTTPPNSAPSTMN